MPEMQDTWVWSLSWEETLEKEMATHSSIPAWKIPWTAKPGRPLSMGPQRVGHDWVKSFHNHTATNESWYLDPWLRNLKWSARWWAWPCTQASSACETRLKARCPRAPVKKSGFLTLPSLKTGWRPRAFGERVSGSKAHVPAFLHV